MRGDHVKLLSEPETPPEQPQPAPFPHTNLQFGPLGRGFAINIMLADDIVITKAFNGQAESEICDRLIQRRQALQERQRNELAVIQRLNTHKERG